MSKASGKSRKTRRLFPKIPSRYRLYLGVFSTFFFLSLIVTALVLMFRDLQANLDRLA